MKRQELKNLLHGVENAGDIIDAIMEINGADIENAKKNGDDGVLNREIERLKGEYDSLAQKLKAYEKGGEKYVDLAEFERLKTFETETLAKAETEKRTSAVKELLKKHNAREDMLPLLMNGITFDSVEFSEDGSLKDGEKLVASLKEKYSAGFSQEAQGAGGAPFAKPNPGAAAGKGSTSALRRSDKRRKKNERRFNLLCQHSIMRNSTRRRSGRLIPICSISGI